MEATLENLKKTILFHVNNYGTNHYIELCVGRETANLRFSDVDRLKEGLGEFLDTLGLRICVFKFGFHTKILGVCRKN